MNYLRLTSLLFSICFFVLPVGAQSLKPLKIQSEISYESISTSSKVTPRKPKNTGLIVTSPPPMTGSESRVNYSIFRTIEAKTVKDKSVINIKTNRIKNKKGNLDVDTDSPFATDEFNKNAMDFYLKELGVQKKIDVSESAKTSGFSSALIPGKLPLLHPIYDLSGVLINSDQPLKQNQSWTDTLRNRDGSFINTYTVETIIDASVVLNLSGRLEPAPFSVDDSKDEMDVTKLVQGANIEAKTSISKFEYQGKIRLNNNNQVINEMNLDIIKDESLSVFGQLTSRSLVMKYIVKNAVK